MPTRRRLGSSYVRSPAQQLQNVFSANMSKIVFAIFMCIVWLGVLYMIVGIIRFLGAEISESWDKDMPVSVLYNSPYCLPFKIAGIIGVLLYVFKDKLTNR